MSGSNNVIPKAGTQSSAGIYQNGKLIRTLWSGQGFQNSDLTPNWDGKDDFGNQLADGNYTLRVLTNDVQYTWEGVLGNTSDSFTGSNLNHADFFMQSMAISNNSIFYGVGYNEGPVNAKRAATSLPNTPSDALTTNGVRMGATVTWVATDNNLVYWAVQGNGGKYFIYDTDATTNNEVPLTASSPVMLTYDGPYQSAFNYATGQITGLAVQTSGAYLFAIRASQNRIDIFNKATGVAATNVTVGSPMAVAVDSMGNIWLALTESGSSVVRKYTVGTGGALTPSTTITGLTQALSLAVSPDGSTLLVADGGASQQVKAFNPSTGASLWTLGSAGGYQSNPSVSDYKFLFKDTGDGATGNVYTFLAFQPDGTFWVGDVGNYRAQHYSAAQTWINRIAWIPTFYNTAIDGNNPTRIFADYLEFAIDYTKALGPANGSWTLKNNWYYSPVLDDTYHGSFNQRFLSIQTLSNGHTYGVVQNSSGTTKIVELPANGPLRDTGVTIDRLSNLYPDGTVHTMNNTQTANTATFTYYAQKLTGFDSSYNPQFGSLQTILTLQTLTNPGIQGVDSTRPFWEVSSSGVLALFDDGNNGTGYHLAGIPTNSSSGVLSWQAAPATHASYGGPFPINFYDIGNTVQYAGSRVMASDRSFYWGYYGEFWKGSETNMFTQMYDDGLYVGQFGNAGPEPDGTAGCAGNAFGPNMTKSNGVTYLYHNDESQHGGIHRWRIDNLSSIQESNVDFTFTLANYRAMTSSSYDLLAGIPFNSSSLASGAGGWTLPTASGITLSVTSSYLVYNPWDSQDMNFSLAGSTSSSPITVSHSIPSTTSGSLKNWTMTMDIAYFSTFYTTPYIYIVDISGKKIAQFYPDQIAWPNDCEVHGNGNTPVAADYCPTFGVNNGTQPLVIEADSTGITFTYASYPSVHTSVQDTGADWVHPAQFQLVLSNASTGFDLSSLIYTPLCTTGSTCTFSP
jgi:hypothetical protein